MDYLDYEEEVRKMIQNVRSYLKDNEKNDPTWVMYEMMNEYSKEDLDSVETDIVEVAELIMEEIEKNPYKETKEKITNQR